MAPERTRTPRTGDGREFAAITSDSPACAIVWPVSSGPRTGRRMTHDPGGPDVRRPAPLDQRRLTCSLRMVDPQVVAATTGEGIDPPAVVGGTRSVEDHPIPEARGGGCRREDPGRAVPPLEVQVGVVARRPSE